MWVVVAVVAAIASVVAAIAPGGSAWSVEVRTRRHWHSAQCFRLRTSLTAGAKPWQRAGASLFSFGGRAPCAFVAMAWRRARFTLALPWRGSRLADSDFRGKIMPATA
jgi:hypothetical protein